MAEKEKDVLLALYGNKAFVKIKQCLEIGKIQFSFVNKENAKEHIECYMEAEDFGALLMQDVKTSSLFRKLAEEKAKGEQYPKAVWTSPIGGNATGNNGKPVSRFFTISPAASGEVLFTAYAYPAVKNATGAFIQEKGSKPLVTLRVPCLMNDLRVLQYKWSFLENDYMTAKYTVESMKSEYQQGNQEADVSEQYTRHVDEEPQNTAATTTSSDEEDEVPFADIKNSDKKETKKNPAESKQVFLKAKTNLLDFPKDNNKKYCTVVENGKEKTVIFLTNKIVDKEKFAQFTNMVTERVQKGQMLEFKAMVCEMDEKYYFLKFA